MELNFTETQVNERKCAHITNNSHYVTKQSLLWNNITGRRENKIITYSEDLSSIFHLQTVPTGIIPSLSKLCRKLASDSYFYEWPIDNSDWQLIGIFVNLGGDVLILTVRIQSKWEESHSSRQQALASVESMMAGENTCHKFLRREALVYKLLIAL